MDTAISTPSSTLLPIVRVHLSVLVSIALLGCTTLTISPHDTVIRAALFPLILAPTIYTAFHVHEAGPVQLWNMYLGMMFGSHYAFNAFHILFLAPETYTPPKPKTKGTWKSNLAFTLDIALNKRRINHPDQTPNIPPYTPPSKPRFLLTRTARFLAIYLTLDILTHHSLSNPQVTCAAGQERILHRLLHTTTLPPPALVELIVIVAGYSLGGVLSLSACYDFASIILVTLGISEPCDWPPIFADPREAYSIRRFWGVFWHQALRIVLASFADFGVHSVLRIPRTKRGDKVNKTLSAKCTSILARYLKLMIALILSGVMHLVADRAYGVDAWESGSVKFFFLHAVGMAVEDCVEGGYHCVRGTKRGGSGRKKTAVWIRIVGFLWVGVFMVFTAPTWGFPVLRKGGTDVVPVKVVGRFL